MTEDKHKKVDVRLFGIYALVLAGLSVWLISWGVTGSQAKLQLAIGYTLLAILFAFGVSMVALIAVGEINLSELLEEMNGGASMSRFQLLVFTMVIAFGFFYLTVTSTDGTFPKISNEVLTLLGLSASTYAVSKGMQVSSGETKPDKAGGGGDDDGEDTPAEVKKKGAAA